MKRLMLFFVPLLFPLIAFAGEKVKGTNFFVTDNQSWKTGKKMIAGFGRVEEFQSRSKVHWERIGLSVTGLDFGTKTIPGVKVSA